VAQQEHAILVFILAFILALTLRPEGAQDVDSPLNLKTFIGAVRFRLQNLAPMNPATDPAA